MAGNILKLSQLGETGFLRRVLGDFPSADPERPGDDCAVVQVPGSSKDLLLKTDSVVEGVHFSPGEIPQRAGRKALCRALSDIAAMGGKPTHALLAVFAPREDELRFWEGFYNGFLKAAHEWGVTFSGGELSSSQVRSAAVTVLGEVPRGQAILRSGGQPGHALYVTGRLGGSLARKHWAFIPRLAEGQWLARTGLASAMLDLSDGLAADLPRLAAACGCGFSLEMNRIPRNRRVSLEAALSDGEDYELLLAVAPSRMARLEKDWKRRFSRLPLTRIGELTEHSDSQVPVSLRRFDHFNPSS